LANGPSARGSRRGVAAIVVSGLVFALGVSAVAAATGGSKASKRSAPVLGKTVDVVPVKGQVFVSLPGRRSERLVATRRIPVGSIVDARHGTVRVISAAGRGAIQSGEFRDGAF